MVVVGVGWWVWGGGGGGGGGGVVMVGWGGRGCPKTS